jgi:hypothetical protein
MSFMPRAWLILKKVDIVGLVLPASSLDMLAFSKLHNAAKSCCETFFSSLLSRIQLPISVRSWVLFLVVINDN